LEMCLVTRQKWQSPKSANWEWIRGHILHILQTLPQVTSSFSVISKTSSKKVLRLSRWTFLGNHGFDGKSRKIASPPRLRWMDLTSSSCYREWWRVYPNIAKQFCYSPSSLSKMSSMNFLAHRYIKSHDFPFEFKLLRSRLDLYKEQHHDKLHFQSMISSNETGTLKSRKEVIVSSHLNRFDNSLFDWFSRNPNQISRVQHRPVPFLHRFCVNIRENTGHVD
jgi:hypothetical protein